MSFYLVKYDDLLGRYRPFDEENDTLGAKDIRLSGELFSKDNIATKDELSALSLQLMGLQNAFAAHNNQQGIDLNVIRNDVEAVALLCELLSKEIRNIVNDGMVESIIEATDGQTVISTTLNFAPSNDVLDIFVFRNGAFLRQDLTGGTDKDYRKLDNNRIELTRPSKDSDRIHVVMTRRYLNTTPADFFNALVYGVMGYGIQTPSRYLLNQEHLWVFRNGVRINKTQTIGEPITRYEESSMNYVTMGGIVNAEEVLNLINYPVTPSARMIQGGLSGAVLTVPTYVMGSDRLLVWRNGVLMNRQALGGLPDQYTETSSTSITLAEAATAEEVFCFEVLASAPSFRNDTDGLTGNVIDVTPSQYINDEHLLVFRNGLLMHRTANSSVGGAADRYLETGPFPSSVVTLEESATSEEVFTLIYLS